MTDQTTTRTSWTTILDSLRNVNNRIDVLTLRRCNNGFLTHDENQELAAMHRKLEKLNKQYDQARLILEARQRQAAANDPQMQRARVNVIRR